MTEKLKEVRITEEQLHIVCWAFHKWFRIADLEDNTDINMLKAIDNLPNKTYRKAMIEALNEANIKLEKSGGAE